MTWIECLCLSVPPSAAVYAAVRAWIAHRTVAGETDRLSSETNAKLARTALVTAAKWRAGALKPDLPPEDPRRKTPYERWLASEGHMKPEAVRDALEAAFAYVAGEDFGAEMGEYGTPEGVKSLFDEHAPEGWYSAAVADAKRRR